jgi:hypothetical protein
METIISHKATKTEVTNRTVRGTPGFENLMTMHAPTVMNVAPQTSSLAFVEDFKLCVLDAVRRLRLSLRPSFMERGS